MKDRCAICRAGRCVCRARGDYLAARTMLLARFFLLSAPLVPQKSSSSPLRGKRAGRDRKGCCGCWGLKVLHSCSAHAAQCDCAPVVFVVRSEPRPTLALSEIMVCAMRRKVMGVKTPARRSAVCLCSQLFRLRVSAAGARSVASATARAAPHLRGCHSPLAQP